MYKNCTKLVDNSYKKWYNIQAYVDTYAYKNSKIKA